MQPKTEPERLRNEIQEQIIVPFSRDTAFSSLKQEQAFHLQDLAVRSKECGLIEISKHLMDLSEIFSKAANKPPGHDRVDAHLEAIDEFRRFKEVFRGEYPEAQYSPDGEIAA